MTPAEWNAITRCNLLMFEVDVLREIATAWPLSTGCAVNRISDRLDMTPIEARDALSGLIKRKIIKRDQFMKRRVYVVNSNLDEWDKPGILRALLGKSKRALRKVAACPKKRFVFGND